MFRKLLLFISGAVILGRLVVYPWIQKWAATPDEAQRLLPGDDLVARPKLKWTNGLTINAPPAVVWPWLVQMGAQDRAGWYSYDSLDNGGVPSATRIVPEWQNLQVGDVVKALPDTEGGFHVAILEPEKTLVFQTLTDLNQGQDVMGANTLPQFYWRTTWGFYLEALNGDKTRLLVRAKADFPLSGKGCR